MQIIISSVLVACIIIAEQTYEQHMYDSRATSHVNEKFEIPGCMYRGSVVDCRHASLREVPSYDEIPFGTTELLLDYNWIQFVGDDSFRHLESLTHLGLSNNNITVIEPNAFTGLVSLIELNLSSNSLSFIHDNLFTPMRKLQKLKLKNVSAEFNSFNPQAFHNMTSLDSLDFSSNVQFKFPVFMSQGWPSMPNLESLRMKNNYIKEVDSEMFRGLEKLKSLDLSNNAVTVIKAGCFAKMNYLKTLTLAKNKLTQMHYSAIWSNSLEHLDLSGTLLYGNYNPKLFAKVANLKSLNLRNCLLYKLLPTMSNFFKNIPGLIWLNLHNNLLYDDTVHKQLHYLKNLTHLDLSKNALHLLNASTYTSFAKTLRILNVASNRITSINETSLPANLWNQLDSIYLRGNPWTCDCGIVWFRRWLRNPSNHARVNNTQKMYMCASQSSGHRKIQIIALVHPTDVECFQAEFDTLIKPLFTCVLLVYLTSFLACVLHRYRWHARYLSFVIKVSQTINQSIGYAICIGVHQKQGRNYHWTRVDKVQGPTSAKGPPSSRHLSKRVYNIA